MSERKDWNKAAQKFYSETLDSKIDSNTFNQFTQAYKKMTERITRKTGIKIVDLGCGTGYAGAGLDPLSLTGIDISAESLKAAQMKNPRTFFVQADLNELPIKNESIHTALAITSIEFCFDRRSALTEASRILKPSGELYLEVRNRDFFLFKILKPLTPFLIKLKLMTPYEAKDFKDLNYNEWRSILKDTGFTIMREYSSLRPWNYGTLLTRIKNLLIEFVKTLTPIPNHFMIAFLCVKQ